MSTGAKLTSLKARIVVYCDRLWPRKLERIAPRPAWTRLRMDARHMESESTRKGLGPPAV